ncbi:MAG TPA: DUF4240 domain-containing protein [Chthoniobacter sp.]|jgi:hypothetical protein
MTEDQHELNEDWFWAIVQRSLDASGGDRQKQNEAIAEELRGLSEEELAFFVRFHFALCEAGYNLDLWGALCLITGGCSGEQLWCFLGWLIGCGRKWFKSALRHPDDLADYPENLNGRGEWGEEFARVAYEIHLEKFEYYPEAELWPGGGAPVEGEPWESKEEVFRARWPKLYARYWNRWPVEEGEGGAAAGGN